MNFSISDPGIQLEKYNIHCINGIYYTIIVAIMLKLETAVKYVQYLCAVFKITSENWIFGILWEIGYTSYPVTNPIDALQKI